MAKRLISNRLSPVLYWHNNSLMIFGRLSSDDLFQDIIPLGDMET